MKRSRGRGRRGGPPNNHTRAFDSAGPEIKIRGTAANIYEKYLQLARDAGSAGDRVAQENYLQHAEHYYRIMMANQVPVQPQGGQQQGGQQQGYQQQGNQQGNYQQPGNSGQTGGQAQGYSGDGRNPNPPQQQPYSQPQPVPGPSFTLSDEGDDGEDSDSDEAAAS